MSEDIAPRFIPGSGKGIVALVDLPVLLPPPLLGYYFEIAHWMELWIILIDWVMSSSSL